MPRSAVERWAEARGATDPLVGLRYDAILILTEVVGIDVGDLIDGNVEGRQPFDRLACGRAAKAVGDEVEAAALGQALGRFDEPQPDEGGKEAVPRGLRPARPALVRLRRPIPKQHHLRRSCGRHDRLRAVEPPAAVIGSQNRAHRALANHVVVDEPGAAPTHGGGTIVHSLGQRHQRIAAPERVGKLADGTTRQDVERLPAVGDHRHSRHAGEFGLERLPHLLERQIGRQQLPLLERFVIQPRRSS